MDTDRFVERLFASFSQWFPAVAHGEEAQLDAETHTTQRTEQEYDHA